MSYIEKEKLIKADIASIENRVRHAFIQGYDLGFKDGKGKAKPQEQEFCDDWYDIPSDEMTLKQARQAVKDLRKKLVEYLEQVEMLKMDRDCEEPHLDEWAEHCHEVIDKSDDFEEWKLNEDKDRYIRIGDILERFKEVDEYFGHDTWTLKQIFSNLNILPSSVFQRFTDEDDCISRKAVLSTLDNMDSALDEDRTVDSYKELLKECYKALPSVTPQEPKTGHWINKQHLFSSCSAECSSCHKRSNGYVFDNGFSLERKYYDYCPNCGSDNREVEK